jgi:hypothetical protein
VSKRLLRSSIIAAAVSGCGTDTVILIPQAAPAAGGASSGEATPAETGTSGSGATARSDGDISSSLDTEAPSSGEATPPAADVSCSEDTLLTAAGERSAPPWSEGLRVCPEDPGYPVLGYGLSRQNHIDELEGCESIHADLTIAAYEGLDLRPLRSLREVRGRLTIGSEYPHGFPSLEGLEGLRRVRGLSLLGVQAPDLTVFSNLELMDGPPLVSCHENGPSLHIFQAENLVDLHGLENVRGIYSVRIEGSPALRSLEGVHFEQDSEPCGGIQIIDSPVREFGDLSGLTELGTLSLSETTLSDLNAFRSLRRLRRVSLERNPNLVDVGVLAQLEFLQRLHVSGNPLLAALPEMLLVCDLRSVRLADNAALVHAPRFPRVSRLSELSVVGQPLLERLDGFASLEQLGDGRIAENESLTEIDFRGLADVTGTLRVLGNPQLDAGSLSNLPGRIKAAGNRDDPDLLSPCPWADDDECDESPYPLCAPGTDPICEQDEE